MGKEFVFIFLDEFLNRTLSKKIDKLRLPNGKLFEQETMAKKVQEDIFHLVRMPYMKSFTDRQYYIISIATYIANLALVILLVVAYGASESKSNPIQYIVSLTSAMIQPLISYSLAGWLYYKCC
jgi:hypothetical protein